MLKKRPPVKIFLLVALFFFFQSLFALEDDGQLNDDPGAIDYKNENIEIGDEVDVTERSPEHTDYPVEETHQVLKYVQDRADAPMYARDPQVKMIEKSKLEINKYKKFSKNKIRITKKSSSKRSKYSHKK